MPVTLRRLEKMQMNLWVFVPCKTDKSQFPGLLRFEQRELRAFFVVENAVRVFEPQNLVMLNQIDSIGFQASQRFVNLSGGKLFGAPVDFRHQENMLALAVLQKFPHSF